VISADVDHFNGVPVMANANVPSVFVSGYHIFQRSFVLVGQPNI